MLIRILLFFLLFLTGVHYAMDRTKRVMRKKVTAPIPYTKEELRQIKYARNKLEIELNRISRINISCTDFGVLVSVHRFLEVAHDLAERTKTCPSETETYKQRAERARVAYCKKYITNPAEEAEFEKWCLQMQRRHQQN